MDYQQLSKKALGCMYLATVISTAIGLGIIAALLFLLFIPENTTIGIIICIIITVLLILNAIFSPWFRYHRYRYHINDECIDILEGYIFIKRIIVPIERLHKLQTSQGPIDRVFGVTKLIVTTAGGDVILRFLEEQAAENIALTLRNRINFIAAEQKNKQFKTIHTENEEA